MLASQSQVPLPFLKPAWMSGSSQLLKPGLENFEHYFTSLWDECNCAVVWAFFGIVFLWDWNENWPFLGEGNGTPLQYSCLENPMDRGAWWATVHGGCKELDTTKQIWKTQQWPQDCIRSVFVPIPKKGNAKECSNYRTIALFSHASKVMLKNSPSQASAICEPWTSRCSNWF